MLLNEVFIEMHFRFKSVWTLKKMANISDNPDDWYTHTISQFSHSTKHFVLCSSIMGLESKKHQLYSLAYKPRLRVKLLYSSQIYNEKIKCFYLFVCLFLAEKLLLQLQVHESGWGGCCKWQHPGFRGHTAHGPSRIYHNISHYRL